MGEEQEAYKSFNFWQVRGFALPSSISADWYPIARPFYILPEQQLASVMPWYLLFHHKPYIVPLWK
jgi:hypothetical protein